MAIIKFNRKKMEDLVAHAKARGYRGIRIAGDDGVYFHSLRKDDIDTGCTVYAYGINPNVDGAEKADSRKRAVWGGDDGVEVIHVSDVEGTLAETRGDLHLKITKNRIAFLIPVEPTPAPAPTAKPAPTVTPKGGIGDTIRESLAKGMTVADTLAAVKILFPNSKTSAACVAWYRSKMKKVGL